MHEAEIALQVPEVGNLAAIEVREVDATAEDASSCILRVLDKSVVVHAEGDRPEQAKADIFPAYDEDGGLLLVLTPR